MIKITRLTNIVSEMKVIEIVDTFVALGGDPINKDSMIPKEALITIIKMEFELTIDMEEYLHTIGGDDSHINYF